jgi:hypothetical protein
VTIFGRIVSGADVEAWSEELVRRWVSTYLAEKERQDGIEAGTLPRPRGWVWAPSADKWPEDQLPALIFESTGIPERPRKGGDGRYRARWELRIHTVASARTWEDSRRLAMRYTAALRALFTQRPSLDGRADGIDWIAERYDELTFDATRSLAIAQSALLVEVDDVTTAGGGPMTPSDPLDPDIEPWPEWPTVQTVDVDVEHEGLAVALPTKEE